MNAVLRAAGATRIAGQRATRRSACSFWSGRKNAFPASGRISSGLQVHGLHHSAQAPGADAAARSQSMERKYGLRCVNVFHAGDGNLHPLILFDANEPDELQRARSVRRRHPGDQRAAGRHRHRRARRRRREARTRCACSSRRPSATHFIAVKRAFDPHELLNPGKVDSDAASLRRVRQDARAPRPAAAFPTCRGSDGRTRSPGPAPTRDRRGRRRARRRCGIRGGGTKDFYGEHAATARCWTCARFAASSSYEPTELVVTARAARRWRNSSACWHSAGSACRSSRRVSAPTAHRRRHGRRRACPDRARASAGAVRDYVLGATLLNGRGELLHLRRPGHEERGRLRCVAPDGRLAWAFSASSARCRSRCCRCRVRERRCASSWTSADGAARSSTRWARQPLPISASAWHDGRLHVRLSGARGRGARRARAARRRRCSSRRRRSAWWRSLRDQTHAFFREATRTLWRLSVPLDRGAARAAGRAAHRMGRRAALVRARAAGRRDACARRRSAADTPRWCAAPTAPAACSRRLAPAAAAQFTGG